VSWPAPSIPDVRVPAAFPTVSIDNGARGGYADRRIRARIEPMLRRLHHKQPESFAFTRENESWAREQIKKFPPGRQASAIIPLLWRAQEQEGWLTRPAMEAVARMLDLAPVRALEVATFYFMFHLHPVGRIAHVQLCTTTPCMRGGSDERVEVCRERIAPRPHQVSPDGKFSWEEVECLGACANAPMAQIGKDFFEDLTAGRLGAILDQLEQGSAPVPGPQNGRFSSEPLAGLTSLHEAEGDSQQEARNASVALATVATGSAQKTDSSAGTGRQ